MAIPGQIEDLNQARPVGALVHAIRILRHLAAQGRAEGATAIARATDINTSTCFNILRTLAAEGLVIFDADAKTYRLGLGLVALSLGVLGSNPSELIRPELDRLSKQYGVLMSLWHLTESDRWVLIDRAFEAEAVRVDLPMGKRLPALIGAVGRMTAAARGLSPDQLRRSFAELRWQAAPEFDAYAADVTRARQDGYAIDSGALYLGVDAVASIICDADGHPCYGVSSVSLAGQLSAQQHAQIGQDLAQTCARLGAALFATPTQTHIHFDAQGGPHVRSSSV